MHKPASGTIANIASTDILRHCPVASVESMFYDHPMSQTSTRILGIEGGGTKTDWVYGKEGRIVQQGKFGTGNMRLIDDKTLLDYFQQMPAEVDAVGVYLAGCITAADRARLQGLVSQIWPRARISLGSDRESGYETVLGNGDGIITIAGTGSSVMGKRAGRTEYASGWGHLLGDAGSGYDMGINALRRVLYDFDMRKEVPPVAHEFLRALQLNTLRDLVSWVANADKKNVAALARVVLKAATAGDAEMMDIVDRCTSQVADYTAAVARRLELENPRIGLVGGMFRSTLYRAEFEKHMLRYGCHATYVTNSDNGAVGAARLAARAISAIEPVVHPPADVDLTDVREALTEQTNPRSVRLHEMNAGEIVDLFIDEERFVETALREQASAIAAGVQLIARSLKEGGRLFYAGAGTSGRLGILDASEIPPTFGAPPSLVQGIMAGGVAAIHGASEAAEDDAGAGEQTAVQRGIRSGDVVCGIAASGRTPFVLGLLEKSRELGAHTIFLTCNPSRTKTSPPWDVEIDLATGPEIITGSTLLKAGTATKVALNILSSGAMILLGKVRGNFMIDVHAGNAKLRDRAIRIVCALRQCSAAEAREMLESHQWNVRQCLV